RTGSYDCAEDRAGPRRHLTTGKLGTGAHGNADRATPGMQEDRHVEWPDRGRLSTVHCLNPRAQGPHVSGTFKTRCARCDMKFARCFEVSRPALLVALALVVAVPGSTQTAQSATAGDNASVNASLAELQSQVRELKEMVLQLQQQTIAGRAEIANLRQELEAQRSTSGTVSGAETAFDEVSPAMPSSSTAQLEHRVDQVAEDEQLLSDKVNEQYQTKLESASKYRLGFSGIVLFNLFAR